MECRAIKSVLTQIIREVRGNKGNFAVLWLDMANIYGSKPHKAVELTLEKYHIPEKFRRTLKDYFDNIRMRFTLNNYTTAWQRFEVGIVTGRTISVIIFAAAMNLMVKSVEKRNRGSYMAAGTRQPHTRSFMDGMTVTTKIVVEGRWTLRDLEEMVTWARMSFTSTKSRTGSRKGERTMVYDRRERHAYCDIETSEEPGQVVRQHSECEEGRRKTETQ